jgi:hypothetical protein
VGDLYEIPARGRYEIPEGVADTPKETTTSSHPPGVAVKQKQRCSLTLTYLNWHTQVALMLLAIAPVLPQVADEKSTDALSHQTAETPF